MDEQTGTEVGVTPVDEQTLMCRECKEIKPMTDSNFYQDKRWPGSYRNLCKPCYSEYNKIRHALMPPGYATERVRERRADPMVALNDRMMTFGKTAQWYLDTLAAQGGGCAICGMTPEENGRRLAVDHYRGCCPGNRSCGKCVRWLLCNNCNPGIAMFKDNVAMLRRAADMLDQRAAMETLA